MGHQLRDRASFPQPKQVEKRAVVIVGGGIAGLSSAWRLHKKGFTDFVLLEMNDQPGGNSRWGENEITAYPWAAHYVPVPGPKAVYVRELFEELGVLEERPMGRTLSLLHSAGAFVSVWKMAGRDRTSRRINTSRPRSVPKTGRPHPRRSALPASSPCPWKSGSPTPRRTSINISFADWLRAQRIDSRILNWYMNYCCRDDYGATTANTSAWAGIQYFASREPEEKGPSNLARRKRLDRPPTTGTGRKLCSRPTAWCTESRDAERGSAFWPETPNIRQNS